MRYVATATVALFGLLALTQQTAQASRTVGGVVAPTRVPAASIATLTADTAQLNGLEYHAPAAGTTPDTIELSTSSAAFTNLDLQSPCVLPGLAGDQGLATTLLAASTQAAQGITFWATSVTGTQGAQTVTWTPANPPAQADLGDVPLADLNVQLVTAAVPALDLPGGARQYSWFC